MLELFSYKWSQLGLSFIHTVSGIIAVLFASEAIDSKYNDVTIYRQRYITRFDSELFPFVNVDVFALLSVFCFITGVAHLIYFVDNMKSNNSGIPLSARYRFLEYSLSAPIMGVVIGILVGITTPLPLFCISGLVATTMLFGYIEEEAAKIGFMRNFWTPWLLGFIPFIFAIVTILWGYVQVVLDSDGGVPEFVHAIVGTQVILFSSFGFVQMYYVTLPSYSGYKNLDEKIIRRMDGVYHILSLSAKMLLTWLAIGGIINME